MKKHTLSLIYHLLSLSLSHTYSFCTLTHSPSHALDLSRLRHSPRSIAYWFIEKANITKFDHVRGEKQLHLERQTYTIRFTNRCSFVWCIFDIVDINNICVNLIKVSKVWLLKKLHALHYRADGISLSPSQLSDAPLSHIGAPLSFSNFISPWFTHTHISLNYIDPSNTLRPCSLSMWHAPPKYHNTSHHHRHMHSAPKYDYLSLTIRNTRIVSFHPYVYLDISRGIFYHGHTLSLDLPPVVPSRSPGDLSMKNIHSLLPMSAFSPYVSLDLSPLFVRPLLAAC